MTKMEITVKYFLSICVLSLVANSTLAGVMPEEAKSSKIKQNQVQINALNYKVGNKNQKLYMHNKVNYIKLVIQMFMHIAQQKIVFRDKNI